MLDFLCNLLLHTNCFCFSFVSFCPCLNSAHLCCCCGCSCCWHAFTPTSDSSMGLDDLPIEGTSKGGAHLSLQLQTSYEESVKYQYIYTQTHTHTDRDTHTHTHIHKHTRARAPVRPPIHPPTCPHTFKMQARKHAHAHAYMHTHTHTHTHTEKHPTHTHTCTYTHTHTHTHTIRTHPRLRALAGQNVMLCWPLPHRPQNPCPQLPSSVSNSRARHSQGILQVWSSQGISSLHHYHLFYTFFPLPRCSIAEGASTCPQLTSRQIYIFRSVTKPLYTKEGRMQKRACQNAIRMLSAIYANMSRRSSPYHANANCSAHGKPAGIRWQFLPESLWESQSE